MVAVIAVLSGKCSPGATTSVVALASCWPEPVVLADCDPAGGDIAPGWLGEQLMQGGMRAEVGVLSFVTATRHMPHADAAALTRHLQVPAQASQVRLLAGLTTAAQAASVGEAGWRRVAHALREVTDESGGDGVDVLVDCGRFGPGCPWPLLWAADLVLLAVRPLPRHVLAARPVAGELASHIPPDRLGLVVCATSSKDSRDAQRALGLPIGVELPQDPVGAAVFSDGTHNPRALRRSPLVRTARAAANRLYRTLRAASAAPFPQATATMAVAREEAAR